MKSALEQPLRFLQTVSFTENVSDNVLAKAICSFSGQDAWFASRILPHLAQKEPGGFSKGYSLHYLVVTKQKLEDIFQACGLPENLFV